MAENESKPVQLTRQDRNRNAIRAGLKLTPVGQAFEQLVYGKLDEARWKRLEDTLAELRDMMKDRNIPDKEIEKEEFTNLFTDVVPLIREATNEDKRRRLRSLLLNAVKIPEGDKEWESARLAAVWLQEIDGPGLEVLAGLVWATDMIQPVSGDPPDCLIMLESEPEPRFAFRDSDNKEFESQRTQGASASFIRYDWPVIEESVGKLIELRLITGKSTLGGWRFNNVELTHRGKFLVRWVLRDE